jgi:hypothetical protein
MGQIVASKLREYCEKTRISISIILYIGVK